MGYVRFGKINWKFTKGINFEQYIKNRLLQHAVERCLEIIGEAARRISKEYQQQHPEIPWRMIIPQRNVLTHEYGEIKHERIWKVISQHVPELISNLEKLIPPVPDSKTYDE